VAPPPTRFPAPVAVQAKSAKPAIPPPPTRFGKGIGSGQKSDACCKACADKPRQNAPLRPAMSAPGVPKPLQKKPAGAGTVVQRSVMSLSSKSDMLPMMSRAAYGKAEAGLNKQGLSLENVIDKPRMSIKPQRGACANYPDVFHAMIGGVAHDVPYDNAHLYACFDQFLHATAPVNIVYTGGRNGDYAAANAAAGLLATPVGYTWHHFENYNNGTGSGTMQLVLTLAHAAVGHRGGVWQWEQATGGAYAA
jgi:hypothetical protein